MTSIPRFEIEFTRDGHVFDLAQVDALRHASAGFSDLLVFCHGWNNDMADARALSAGFLEKVEEVLDGNLVPELSARTFGAMVALWPSKKFTEQELIPGGGAASLGGVSDTTDLERMLNELKNDPHRLGETQIPAGREEVLDKALALVPALETDAGARGEFVELLRSLLNRGDAHADDGSEEFFTRDPADIFREMGDSVVAPLGPNPGGSASLRDNAGGAAGLKDIVAGVIGAARRIANFTTYYQMKERAGTVGRTGLNQVLRQLRRDKPALRLHLIGHSFGARVVTAAVDAFDDHTPAVTLMLVQGAYSHNGLAENFDGDRNDGFFRKVISKQRGSGPILITHTKNDTAVGVAYPLASRLSHAKASAFGDENDPYGGLGRNGAQFTPEAKGLAQTLAELTNAQPGPYSFAPGKVYNLKADAFIGDHNDICKHQVAYAMLKAAATV
jgi:pimeloyl-ACP methyl ester carboxylesterase